MQQPKPSPSPHAWGTHPSCPTGQARGTEDLRKLQGWNLHSLFGQPVPLLDFYCFYCEKIFFLRSSLNPSSYNLSSLSSHCVLL